MTHARRGSGPRNAIPGKSRAFAASSARSSITALRERPLRRRSSSTRSSAARPSRTETGCPFAIATCYYAVVASWFNSVRAAELAGAKDRGDPPRRGAQDPARRRECGRLRPSSRWPSRAARSPADAHHGCAGPPRLHARAGESPPRAQLAPRRRPRGSALRESAAALDRSSARTCGSPGRLGHARPRRARRRARRRPGSAPSSSPPIPADARLEVALDGPQGAGREIAARVYGHGRLAAPAPHTHMGASLSNHFAAIPPQSSKHLTTGHPAMVAV